MEIDIIEMITEILKKYLQEGLDNERGEQKAFFTSAKSD